MAKKSFASKKIAQMDAIDSIGQGVRLTSMKSIEKAQVSLFAAHGEAKKK